MSGIRQFPCQPCRYKLPVSIDRPHAWARRRVSSRRQRKEWRVELGGVVVGPEFWSVIATGIVMLIAIATSNRSLRREMGERIAGVQRETGERSTALQREMGERIAGAQRETSERIASVQQETGERSTALQREMGERITGAQRETSERITALQQETGERITALHRETGDRIAALHRDLGARIDVLAAHLGDVRERLGRIEGLLEGLGLARRKPVGKGRDEQNVPAPSPS